MKIQLKINIEQNETLSIESSEHNTGNTLQDNLQCVEEIICLLKFHEKFFPKSVGTYLHIYQKMKKEIMK